jgi:porphobilinogen synthase
MSGTLSRRATAAGPALEKLCPGLPPSGSGGGGFPSVRPRRLRQSAALRRLVAEVRVNPADLVLPLFVKEGLTEPHAIDSMPGVVQHSRDSLRKAALAAVEAGVGGLMLFGVPAEHDSCGTSGTDPDGILQQGIADLIAEVGQDTVVMSDLCLDEFTDHGHCGVLAPDGSVDNDATLLRYAEMAVAQADAGAHVLGLSGMMDGQVGVVRAALDAAGHTNAVILAYAAKYASGFYGPFREAVDSQLKGDRKTYQQDPPNAAEALREVALDIAEGADIIMVKPALPYLDVLRQVADAVDVPVAAYQVSGEYAMVEAAAANGWINREQVMMETLVGARRAGADFVLTYWATEAAALVAR